MSKKEDQIKVGDTIVCINNKKVRPNTIAPPLLLNYDYIISRIHNCSCGKTFYDVGLGSDPKIRLTCSSCDETIDNDPTHWCDSVRFTKKKSKEEKIAEALEEENYELLAEMRDNGML